MSEFTLYHTVTSPYARIVLAVVHEKNLVNKVSLVEAKTRVEGSSYYEINPSGRVPYLVRESDGMDYEDSSLIVDILDKESGSEQFGYSEGEVGITERRAEAQARSLLDGLAVWARESRRPGAEQSETIISHERARATRMTRFFEGEIKEPPYNKDSLNIVQLTLFVALDLERRPFGFDWRTDCPRLSEWKDRMAGRPSIRAICL